MIKLIEKEKEEGKEEAGEEVKSKDDCNQATNRCKPKDREQGSSQRSETQINWINPELLETIESIPYHEHFIHMHDGSLPRG